MIYHNYIYVYIYIYRYDGMLRRKDRLKEAMYMKQHPDITIKRIRWDEVDKIGYETLCNEIVMLSLYKSKNMNVISKAMRAVEREISGLINWGLRNTKNNNDA